MSIIGTNVIHEKFGRGIIIQNEGNRLLVLFNDEEEPRGFQFPMCFEKSFLNVTSAKDSKKVEKLIADCRCDICGAVGVKTEVIDKTRYCEKCKDDSTTICNFCGRRHANSNSERVSVGYFDTGYVCIDCLDSHTFICSICGSRRLEKEKIDSPYISCDVKICTECAYKCHKCGTYADHENIYKAFGKYYCSGCWDKYMTNCSVCGNEFVPEDNDSAICDDCIKMKGYIKRVKDIDFSKCEIIEINYSSLKRINRCELFTNLFCNYQEDLDAISTEDDYSLLVLDTLFDTVIITYLPYSIVGNINPSVDVTMTQFRQSKFYWEVLLAIKKWKNSNEYLETPAGKVELLNYPVLLRVQTKYDKIYGKEWFGPDCYYEIGNYGDTTEFYIIGVLCDENDT